MSNDKKRPFISKKTAKPSSEKKEKSKSDRSRAESKVDGREKRNYQNRDEGAYKGKRSYGDKKPFRKDGDKDEERKGGYKGKREFGDKKPYRKYNDSDSEQDSRREGGYKGKGSYNQRDDNRGYSKGNNGYKKFRKKHVVEEKPKMPLNKFLAHAGLGNRRETVDLIRKGDVKVNDEVETSPSYQVKDSDVITYKDEVIENTKDRIYILANKAPGVTSALNTSDKNRNLSSYTTEVSHKNLLPIGKLKKNTSGLIILSNDGDLANQLNDKKALVENVYRLHTDQTLTKEDRDKLLAGVKLLGDPIKIEEIHDLDPEDDKQLGIKTHFEGDEKVYKLFKELGYSITKLDRVIYAGLSKKNLPRGTSRILNAKELVKLKHFNKYK